MRTRLVMLGLTVVASAALLACQKNDAPPAAPVASAGHRVVIEVNVDGQERWEGILNNVDNLQKAFGADKPQIEVVAHAKGLALLLATNDALKARMQEEHEKGVIFAGCENTMRKQNVTKEQLLPFATTVDSGVAEVVRKQEAGWSYIKGGG